MFLYECQVPGIQYTVAVHEQLSDIVASGLLLGSIRHQVCPQPPRLCCESVCWQALLATDPASPICKPQQHILATRLSSGSDLMLHCTHLPCSQQRQQPATHSETVSLVSTGACPFRSAAGGLSASQPGLGSPPFPACPCFARHVPGKHRWPPAHQRCAGGHWPPSHRRGPWGRPGAPWARRQCR